MVAIVITFCICAIFTAHSPAYNMIYTLSGKHWLFWYYVSIVIQHHLFIVVPISMVCGGRHWTLRFLLKSTTQWAAAECFFCERLFTVRLLSGKNWKTFWQNSSSVWNQSVETSSRWWIRGNIIMNVISNNIKSSALWSFFLYKNTQCMASYQQSMARPSKICQKLY